MLSSATFPFFVIVTCTAESFDTLKRIGVTSPFVVSSGTFSFSTGGSTW